MSLASCKLIRLWSKPKHTYPTSNTDVALLQPPHLLLVLDHQRQPDRDQCLRPRRRRSPPRGPRNPRRDRPHQARVRRPRERGQRVRGQVVREDAGHLDDPGELGASHGIFSQATQLPRDPRQTTGADRADPGRLLQRRLLGLDLRLHTGPDCRSPRPRPDARRLHPDHRAGVRRSGPHGVVPQLPRWLGKFGVCLCLDRIGLCL